MPNPIQPRRLDAWDEVESADGYYIVTVEMQDWAKAVLADCAATEPVAARHLLALIDHLEDSSNT